MGLASKEGCKDFAGKRMKVVIRMGRMAQGKKVRATARRLAGVELQQSLEVEGNMAGQRAQSQAVSAKAITLGALGSHFGLSWAPETSKESVIDLRRFMNLLKF